MQRLDRDGGQAAARAQEAEARASVAEAELQRMRKVTKCACKQGPIFFFRALLSA